MSNLQPFTMHQRDKKHWTYTGEAARITSEQSPLLKEKMRMISRQVAERNRQLYKELENV
ncbi:MAG: hypothetical protein IJ631_03250 [Schwartzia sp.]|nr:hypothetical protein [Schwartzia sp. (in: firmicutes)]